jgi:hypothetical protein
MHSAGKRVQGLPLAILFLFSPHLAQRTATLSARLRYAQFGHRYATRSCVGVATGYRVPILIERSRRLRSEARPRYAQLGYLPKARLRSVHGYATRRLVTLPLAIWPNFPIGIPRTLYSRIK